MSDFTKCCTKCELTLPIEAFTQRTDRRSRQARCKACVSVYNAERYRRDPERHKDNVRAWQSANRERVLANSAAYQRTHSVDRREAKRRRRRQGLTVYRFPSRLVAERMSYFGNKCWMCGCPATTVDHVKPLSKGGVHIPANLRPACLSCNSRKQARWYGVARLNEFCS